MSEPNTPNAMILAVRAYTSLGWAVIPPRARSKAPCHRDWQHTRADSVPLANWFPPGRNHNVGVVLGSASGGLVDVDLDCPQAVRAAAVLLPDTAWKSGRPGKPYSHYWYRVTPEQVKGQRFEAPGGSCLLELRGDGLQTMLPPSIHPQGERCIWHGRPTEQPAQLACEVLRASCTRLAAVAMLARCWPGPGSRQDAHLALAGTLLRAGWSIQGTRLFILALVRASLDEEEERRLQVVEPTAKKIRAGQPTTGWPHLRSLLGAGAERELALVRRWLQFREPRGWPEPIPLNDTPPAPAFPVQVLPQPLQQYLAQQANSMGCPIDFLALPLLALAGSALGAHRRLRIKPGFEQYANLYAAIVGRPGSGKTPALQRIAHPLYGLSEQYHRDYLQAREAARQATASGDDQPVEPTPRRVWVADATTEALSEILAQNPRGLALVCDELASWVQGMNQYKTGKGHDRPFYLSMWSGAPIRVDRKNNKERGPILVARPFLTVCGGLQPALLDKLVDAAGHREAVDDGFLDRLLLAFPDPLPAWAETWEVPDPALQQVWDDCYRKVRQLPGSSAEPVLLTLSEEARAAWTQFTAEFADEVNSSDFPDLLRGPWSKMVVYAVRLMLILHSLDQVFEELGDVVQARSVRGAAQLVTYFKGQLYKVHASMRVDPAQHLAQLIVERIRETGKPKLSRREIHRLVPRQARRVTDLIPALDLLQGHGLIRLCSPEQTTPRGRHSPLYEIHPHVLRSPGDD